MSLYRVAKTFAMKIMSAFLILWGLWVVFIGFVKYYKHTSLVKWSFQRIYYMFAYCMWGFGFVAGGLAVLFPSISREANMFYGATFILMVFAPCGIDVFNVNPLAKAARNVIFALWGIWIMVSA